MYYSSDSDCDYTFFVEVTKTPKLYKHFQKRVQYLVSATDTGSICPSRVDQEEYIGGIKEELALVPKTAKLTCSYCDKAFAYEQLMKEHVQYRHIEEDGAVEIDLENLDRNVPIDCCKCTSRLKNFKFYRRHLKLRHNLIVVGMPFGEGDIKVKLTDLPIQMKFSNLNKGKKGPFECKHCAKLLSNGKLLKEHIRLTHKQAIGVIELDWSSMEEFVCPECGRKVKSKRNLRRHLRLCHNLAVQAVAPLKDQVDPNEPVPEPYPINKVVVEGSMQWR